MISQELIDGINLIVGPNSPNYLHAQDDGTIAILSLNGHDIPEVRCIVPARYCNTPEELAAYIDGFSDGLVR